MRYPRIGNISELAGVLLTVVLLAVLVPMLAAKGAAIASTVAYITSAVAGLAVLRHVEKRTERGDRGVVTAASGDDMPPVVLAQPEQAP